MFNTSNIDYQLFDTSSAIIVVDGTSYNPDLPETVIAISVTPPNFETATKDVFPCLTNKRVDMAFLFPYAGYSDGCTDGDLVDGIYTFNLSITNQCLNKEKKYLRVYTLKSQIITLSLKAIDACDNKQIIKYYKLLQDLSIAQGLVECGQEDKGVVIFNSVKSDIESTCFNC